MLHNKLIVVLITFLLPEHFFASDELCRLIELDSSDEILPWSTEKLEQRLFYRTQFSCHNKPIFRSLFYENLFQFQSKNNRWWNVFQSNESIIRPSSARTLCDAWNLRPILTVNSNIFQQIWTREKRFQRWKRVFFHPNNRTYTYKSTPKISVKCHRSIVPAECENEKVTFLFDLTKTTSDDELNEMRFWSKTLIWLLREKSSFVLSRFSDVFRILSNSFSSNVETLFDEIDQIERSSLSLDSVPWPLVLGEISTKIYQRRFVVEEKENVFQNESSEEFVFTEPFPLDDSEDEHSIKTIVNITTFTNRTKRSIGSKKEILLILTSRSKSIYDFTKKEKFLEEILKSFPIRIVVVDFNRLSDKTNREFFHSALIERAKFSLSSPLSIENYVETFETRPDSVHGEQILQNLDRICRPNVETFSTSRCVENQRVEKENLCFFIDFSSESKNLSAFFENLFYRTTDRCFSSFVYRSLVDRNLYLQRFADGKSMIVRVDPHLPSKDFYEENFRKTTTTPDPIFDEGSDYALGPLIDEVRNETSEFDPPNFVPFCSDEMKENSLWQSESSAPIEEKATGLWFSTSNRSVSVESSCSKKKIVCSKENLEIFVILNVEQRFSLSIRNFFEIFLNLFETKTHRISFVVFPSNFLLSLRPMEQISPKELDEIFSRFDSEIRSTENFIENFQNFLEKMAEERDQSSSERIVFTFSSDVDFDPFSVDRILQRFSSFRFLSFDPIFKDDQNPNNDRIRNFRFLTSRPLSKNFFQTFSSNRDLVFNTILRVIQSLCGILTIE